MDTERAIAIVLTPVLVAAWNAAKKWRSKKWPPTDRGDHYTSVSVLGPLRISQDKGSAEQASSRSDTTQRG